MMPFDSFWAGSEELPRGAQVTARTLFESSPTPLRSRCAPFEIPGKPTIWIKRDDELSFGASGSKVRKYASLVPALVGAGVTDALVLGARNSNNVLAGAQLLTEAGIRCHLFLRSSRIPELPDTIFDLVRQLVPEERISHIPRDDWDEFLGGVGSLQAAMAREGRMSTVIPEGGSRVESLPGAMTLGLDICRNERELSREFSDFFIEAGTGLSAIGLALGLAAESGRHKKLHVLCTAGGRDEFLKLYRRWTVGTGGRAPEVTAYEAGPMPARWPVGAMEALAEVSRAAGVLFDPYYSGRLLQVLGAALDAGTVGPNTMLVHTGGMGLLSHLEWERIVARARLSANEELTFSGIRAFMEMELVVSSRCAIGSDSIVHLVMLDRGESVMTHSLDRELVDRILQRSMPSFQLTSADDQNLGLGYIYYGIARAMRPKKIVVIGSKAGFAPLCFARALADNNSSRVGGVDCYDVSTIDVTGSVDFIDPSYSMDAGDPKHAHGIGYWDSPSAAEELWNEFDVSHVVKHFKQTSAEYIANLPADFEIDLLYIDGDHSYEGVLHDFLSFLPFLGRESLVLAHDVDPQCRSAQGYQVLQELVPETYSAARIPIYPGLAFMLPASNTIRERAFAPSPVIGGYHTD